MRKDLEMIDTMGSRGDEFVKALANAMVLADANNYVKLIAAFPQYVSEYRKLAKEKAKEVV